MRRLLAATVVVVLGASPVAAGVLFEIETREHGQDPPRTTTARVAVEGRRLSMGIAPSEQNRRGGAMLFHGERREMAILNHQDKSYIVMDAGMVRQLAGQLNQAMSQMQEALRTVPEGQRAAVEQMMKSRMPAPLATTSSLRQTEGGSPAPLEVKRRSETAEVYGYPCQLYEVRRDGRKIRDMWVTDWSHIEGGRELAPVFADLGEFQQELLSALPQMGDTGGMEDNAFTTMKEIGGFPVASRDYAEDGSVKSETALRSAKSQRLNPAAFEPPAGYERQQMPGVGTGR